MMARSLAAGGSAQAVRPRSVPLDNARAARGFEPAAKLAGVACRRERTHHGAIINPLRTEVGASNDGGPAAQLDWELVLQRTEGRLRVGFAPLRGNLHDIVARPGGGGRATGPWLRRLGMRRQDRSLRGARTDIVGPEGVGACGPHHGPADQRERCDKAAAPPLMRRVVVLLFIVRIRRGIAVEIVSLVVLGPRTGSVARVVRLLIMPTELFRVGGLRTAVITAARLGIRIVQTASPACLIGIVLRQHTVQ